MSDDLAVIAKVQSFVDGEMDIADFMRCFNESDEIAQYLESIIELIEQEHIPVHRRTVCMKGVAQNRPFEMPSYAECYIKEYAQNFVTLNDHWKENPPKVGEHLRTLPYQTAQGAFIIHGTVSDIYYQIDPDLIRTEKYDKEYAFFLSVLPRYLAGGITAEDYVSRHILPRFPASMKKGERKRLIREEISKAFLRECKGFPRWIQSPEWPLGSDGRPMIYTGQKNFQHYSEYDFKDAVSGELQTVTQWW